MLSDRQKKIMIAIVQSYTESPEKEPVGSLALSKMEGLDYSTATLRNEMAALEEMGYLEKTHTSSGRIPSEKGYRCYVDELCDIENLKDEIFDEVSHQINSYKLPKKDACLKFVENLINLPDYNYGAIHLEKTAFNARIRKIDFVYIKHHVGMFIMVTDKGDLLSNKVSIPEGYSITSIEKTTTYFNEKLNDVLLNDLKNARLINIINDSFFDYISNADAILEFVLRNILSIVEDKKQIIGQYNILKHVDFSDIDFAKKYLASIEDESIYSISEFDNGPLPVISSLDGSNISVKIGSENNNPVMKNCSSVTAYYNGKEGTGSITIFGPLRMRYRYIILLLDAIVKNINMED